MKEKSFNTAKWQIYYQSWIPYDEQLNEYFDQQRNNYIKKENKRLRKLRKQKFGKSNTTTLN